MDDVILDPEAALPRLGPLRAALAVHDWSAVRRVVDAATPSERSLLVLAAEPADPEGYLDHVLGRDPSDAFAAALLAMHRIGAAWRIRTSAPASQVSRGQFAMFDEGLQRAEWVLVEAAARRPDDPTLWTLRLATARGLQLGLAECRRRYDRLAAADPAHLPGQQQLLQVLCPKWGGTWDAAFAFARECSAAAAPGSLGPLVVVAAHVERWQSTASDDGIAAADGYLRDAAVRNEVVDAARRSVWSPAFAPVPGWVAALSDLAFVLDRQQDAGAAADVLGRLGPLADPSPWDALGDPAAQVREARARAFAGAAR